MADAPSPPAAVKAGGGRLAKALTGHSTLTYVAVGGGAIGLVFYLRSREHAQADVIAGPDSASTPVMGVDAGGSYYGGGTADAGWYPGPTQGAFLGQAQAPDTTVQEANQNAAWAAAPTFGDVIDAVAALVPILGGGGAPVTTVADHLPATPVVTAAPAAPPVQTPPAPAAPVGVTIAGKFFPGAVSHHMQGGGTNKYGQYNIHIVVYPRRSETWWHYSRGPSAGKWTGPH